MKSRRVNEFGLIEVLVDAELIWGLHNYTYSREPVKKGSVFNSINSVGSWHDLIPKSYCAGGQYFRRIGECIPYEEIQKRNKHL